MITEFNSGETCTAVITSHLETGENFDGAISVGYYKDVGSEIWVQAQGLTINIQLADLSEFIKQLKRAAKIAGEQS